MRGHPERGRVVATRSLGATSTFALQESLGALSQALRKLFEPGWSLLDARAYSFQFL